MTCMLHQGAPQLVVCRKGLYKFEKDLFSGCHALFYLILSWMQKWMYHSISNIERNATSILMKERCYCCIHLLEPDLYTITEDSTDCLVGDFGNSSHVVTIFFLHTVFCTCFLCIFECTTPVIIFLLITIHGCIYALCWPKTLLPKICAIALEVLHIVTNICTAFLAAPFFISAWCVMAKYCQT